MMSVKSDLEALFLFQIRAVGLPEPETQYRFASPRRWRFDIAYPDRRLAAEIEGGTWTGGRHVRGSGFEKDCEKYNEAVLRGWRVFRFTGGMVDSGEAIKMWERAVGVTS